MIYNDITELIGSTPLVRLNTLCPPANEVIVKLESCNPTNSIKDRAALAMIDAAEKEGYLTPSGMIVESSSGNLGKSLAMIAASRGYRVMIVIDPKTPLSTRKYYEALGAETVLVETPDDSGSYQKSRIKTVKEIVASQKGAFWPDQYNNPNNPKAHRLATGPEIVEQGKPDAIVMAVSTGGHLRGVSEFAKSIDDSIDIIAVDALGSAALGGKFTGYGMRGLGLSWPAVNASLTQFDYIHQVSDEVGIATMRSLARNEGILVGESSGAAVFAGITYAYAHPGKRVIVVAADDGANYLAESFDKDWMADGNGKSVIPDFSDPEVFARFAISEAKNMYATEGR